MESVRLAQMAGNQRRAIDTTRRAAPRELVYDRAGVSESQVAFGCVEGNGIVRVFSGYLIVQNLGAYLVAQTDVAITGSGLIVLKASKLDPSDAALVLQGTFDAANDTYFERPICTVEKNTDAITITKRWQRGNVQVSAV